MSLTNTDIINGRKKIDPDGSDSFRMTKKQAAAYNTQNKFNPDGSVGYFPGNTVVSFIGHDTEIFRLYMELRTMLEKSPAGNCMTFLPPDSVHITIFEGVCDMWRTKDSWTNKLPLDCALEDVDKLFEIQFRKVKPLGCVQLKAVRLRAESGYMIAFEPVSEEDCRKLKDYRDKLSKLFGVRLPNHDTYGFHTSLGYITRPADDEQEKAFDEFEAKAAALIAEKGTVFTLEEPCMTYFRNMFGFEKQRFERP